MILQSSNGLEPLSHGQYLGQGVGGALRLPGLRTSAPLRHLLTARQRSQDGPRVRGTWASATPPVHEAGRDTWLGPRRVQRPPARCLLPSWTLAKVGTAEELLKSVSLAGRPG